tara:strand:- start:2554 stop:2835 length:282 start_codon:yes stop_codon:yes gene_type:complete
MTNTVNKITKTARVLSALTAGVQMTAQQMHTRFDVANPSATIDYLRKSGHAVYCNPRVNGRGETRNFYRLGTPTKSIVAAGYRALQGGAAAMS